MKHYTELSMTTAATIGDGPAAGQLWLSLHHLDANMNRQHLPKLKGKNVNDGEHRGNSTGRALLDVLQRVSALGTARDG